MPSVGHDSSTRRSFGPGEYTPTDDAWTSAPAPACAAASNTRFEPTTLTRSSSRSSREGWITQARCTTASAPAKCGSSGSEATSARTQRVRGLCQSGSRRAMPTISSTRSSAARARSSAVPTLPVAPVTTIRMRSGLPASPLGKLRAG